MSSLFDRIGGEAAMHAAIELFYVKVLDDDRISHFFDGTDMERQAMLQEKFLTMAFGGPQDYPGRDMEDAHETLVEDMGLSDEHFDAVVENLGETLSELGVPAELIGEAAEIAESVRDAVLGRIPA